MEDGSSNENIDSQKLEDSTLKNLVGVDVYDAASLEKGVVEKIEQDIQEKELTELKNKVDVLQKEVRVLKNTIELNEKQRSTISKRNYSEATLLKLKTLTSQSEKHEQKLNILERKLMKAQFDVRVKSQKIAKKQSEPDRNSQQSVDEINEFPANINIDVSAAKTLKERSELIRRGLATPFSFDAKKQKLSKSSLKFDDAFSNSLTPVPSSSDAQRSDKRNETLQPLKKLKRKMSVEKPRSELPEKFPVSEESHEYVPSSSESEDEMILQSASLSNKRKRQRGILDDANPKVFKRRLNAYKHQLLKDMVEGSRPLEDKVFDGGLKVPGDIWKRLYKYQKTGVKWLWELHTQQAGGILGDEMGLGKTIQVIAFLAALSKSKIRDRDPSFSYDGLGPVLIVTPTTVMHQWVQEFHEWAPFLRVAILHSSGSHKGSQRDLISNIVLSRGVLVTSYERVRLAIDNLLGHGWHYLILDEGHKIRNPEAGVSHAVKLFPTPHRFILSGSPIQNHLRELWSLFDFVFPGKLGTLPVFMEQFSVPIVQGGYANASEVEVQTAYKCACMLRNTIAPYLLRRMKQDVQCHIQLPEKSDQVLFCSLTPHQVEIYQSYLNSDSVNSILSGRLKVFVGLIQLRKICNHPDLFTGGPKILSSDPNPEYGDERRYGFWKRSGKMIVVDSLLRIWKKQGKKVLLFTQSKLMLNVLEDFVKSQNYSYLTMHGGSPISSRQPLVNAFNEDTTIFIFILTTRVGGLGVNLIGADRVVIFDPDWNPSTDAQAQERAWRIGQDKQVTIYRLLTAGTIEEKIYHRQIFKHFVSNRILKDPRQRRFFKANDMHELFLLGDQYGDASRKKKTETAAIFAGTGSEIRIEPKRKRKSTSHLHLPKRNDSADRTKDDVSSCEKVERFKADRCTMHNKQINESDAQSSAVDQSLCSVGKSSLDSQSQSDVVLDIDHSQVANNNSKDNPSSSSNVADDPDSSTNTTADNFKRKDSVVESNVSEPRDVANEPSKSNKLKTSFLQALEKFKRSRAESERTSKSHKKKKHCIDGDVVPNLVKRSKYKRGKSSQEKEERMKSDDYVLSKLFNKGVHSALKHTKIMESGVSDYALVEAEASRVAKEAVRNVRLSRQRYKYPQAKPAKKKARFGAVSSQSILKIQSPSVDQVASTSSPTCKSGPLSSSDLLKQIKRRNHIEKPENNASSEDEEIGDNEDNLFFGEDDKILHSLVDFISAQNESRATTQSIMKEFKHDVSTSQAPKFRAMLHKVCTQVESENGDISWLLKEEFR